MELKSLVRIQAGQHLASPVYSPGDQGYIEDMFGKNLLFYIVAGTIMSVVAQALGANIGIVLFAGFLGPPVLLLALAVMRHNRWL